MKKFVVIIDIYSEKECRGKCSRYYIGENDSLTGVANKKVFCGNTDDVYTEYYNKFNNDVKKGVIVSFQIKIEEI